ncbi:MAG: glycosyltransferase family 2 protein [Thermodesulfobacteriota bacterium]
MSTGREEDRPSLSVVVVNWNGAAYLGDCLESVRGEDREVLVVDNASTDGSAALVAQRFPDVRWLANPDNLGFARAANRGLRAARADHVLFLNPDARANDEAIAAAVSLLAQRPDVGLVGVAVRDANGRLTPTVEPFFSLAALRRPWVRRVRAPQGPEPVEIDWCHGAFFLGRRADLLALGGYDEAYFLYAEDMDLCFRMHAAGRSVVYLPQVSIVHEGNVAGREVYAERRSAAIFASCLIFHRRHHGAAATLLLRAAATPVFAARAALYRLTGSPLAERYAALAGVALRGRLVAQHAAPATAARAVAAAGER